MEQAGVDLTGTPDGEVGRGTSGSQFSIENQNWSLSPVHARRAGCADLHGEDRRDGAVDRRQVLRVDPGDGRGPPRRGVRQVPRHQAVGPLPDQRPPADAPRRHHQRQPVGHDLPRHAGDGRGPGPGGVRHGHADDRGPAAQEAAALRHERRGPPRRLRRAVAERVLRGPDRRPSCSSARSSRSRPPSACATASCSRRCGSAWASTSRQAIKTFNVGDKNQDPFQQLLFSKIVPNTQEARSPRRQRRLAAQALRHPRRDPVRGLGRHRRGVPRDGRGDGGPAAAAEGEQASA